MNKATMSDLPVVMSYFKKHRDKFPHVRLDKIKQHILNGQVILEDDVVITFRIYQRRTKLGNIVADKGNATIHQIVTNEVGNGNARKVINKFFDYINTSVYLTVRKDNARAINFYDKVGMALVGDISWKNNSIKGYVFLKPNFMEFIQ